MRRLNISMVAVGVLFLCLNFTTAQAASGRGVTSAAPSPSTTQLAAKKKHWKGYHCPPGQAKKFRC